MHVRARVKPAPSGAGFLLATLAVAWAAPGPLAVAQVAAPSAYLQRIDGDGSGDVSLAEYQHWMGYAFHRMDRDGDGVLAPHELPGGRGAPVHLADHLATLAAAFARQDANGDGALDAAELTAPPR
jgi:hypothetical protein